MNRRPTVGVRYNVIRRPLSGGRGTIVQGKGTEGSKCPKCKGASRNAWKCPKCDGVGRINAKPPESKEDYYARLGQYIRDEPQTYFMRWKIPVLQVDVKRYEERFLVPILEQLCDWWEYIKLCREYNADPFSPTSVPNMQFDNTGIHWQHPYGVYNTLDEGGSTYMDNYLATGSESGLVRAERLFKELS